jgi:para-nitrobenzyl esterase
MFGQSGGGIKINTLMAMPAARNLFHKAILQSGSGLKVKDAAAASEVAARIYRKTGIRSGDVKALQALSTAQLLACYKELSADGSASREGVFLFEPVVDGVALPRQPWDPSAPDSAQKIPMIIGSTTEESVVFVDRLMGEPIPDDRSLLEKIARYSVLSSVSDARLPQILALYRREMPKLSNTELLVRISTDLGFWHNALQQVARKIEGGGDPRLCVRVRVEDPVFRWTMGAARRGVAVRVQQYGVWSCLGRR